MRTLAILHRDAQTAAALKSSLESEGLRGECFTASAGVLAAIHRRAFTLVLLDLAVAGADPFELCAIVSRTQPVICLTDDHTEATVVRALAAGADDCVRAPVAARELIARIRNVLRRIEGEVRREPVVRRSVQIFLDAMRVRLGDHLVDLTRGEAEILSLLVRRAPGAVTVTQMQQMLPPSSAVKRGTIESRIKSLRRKIGHDVIVSRGAFGYQLTSES